jgi:hypothetical protein
MTLALALCGPLLVAALVALNLFWALRRPAHLQRLARAALRALHRRAESVDFWPGGDPKVDDKKGKENYRLLAKKLITTQTGLWGLLSSMGFLFFWVFGWVSPQYTIGFVAHLGGSWIAGIAVAGLALGSVWAVLSAWRMTRAQFFSSRTGFTRLWMARACRPRSRFGEALHEAFQKADRIDILDFTGYELIAKGPSEAGGVIATLLAQVPDKEVRVLLFNPCAAEIDPDRKQNTVVQSQLSAMEMSREAFESKLRATMDRVQVLNRHRTQPIDVRLYSEKPSFRAIVAGELSLLGAIDPRDAAGEFPLYEARRQGDGPSLHLAARSHFLRVWGDSSSVTIEAAATIEDLPVSQYETPVPRPGVSTR